MTATLALPVAALVGAVIFLASQPRADLHRVYRVGVDNLRPYQFFRPDGSPRRVRRAGAFGSGPPKRYPAPMGFLPRRRG